MTESELSATAYPYVHHGKDGPLTQTAVYGLDQEFSYPVERNVNGSALMHVDLAHDMIMWDASKDRGRKHESRKRAGRFFKLTCVLSGGLPS
jgi:hypothetical protein